MKLIIGLGNPGSEYINTRHNIGFMAIDTYLNNKGEYNYKEKFGGIYFEYLYNGEKIIFLKPQQYINLSGMVLRKYLDYYNISNSDILVINDDMDLDIGSYKLKPQGSSAGHNGLKNIEQYLGTSEYKRLKIGISNNRDIDGKDYVLGKFNKKDLKIINDVMDVVIKIIDDYLLISFDDLMNKYNKKQ